MGNLLNGKWTQEDTLSEMPGLARPHDRARFGKSA